MDVRLINPFITSSRAVFDKMVHVPLRLGRPFVRQTAAPPNYSVSAIIGMAGAVTGCVVLGFSTKVATALASGITGAPVTALDADCVDALGEIVNMVAGAAKKDLPGGLTTMSTPNVVLGSHSIKYPSGTPVLVIPCETDTGDFVIEVAIRPTPDGVPAAADAHAAASAVAPSSTQAATTSG
jgi:chemotaxis protein CheX